MSCLSDRGATADLPPWWAAPPLLTALVIGLGAPGWLGLAAVFAAAAVATPALIRWALRKGVGQAKSSGLKSLGSTSTSQLPELSRITASTP